MIGKLTIMIARDSMFASAFVSPEGNTEITEELVCRELANNGIVSGIMNASIVELAHSQTYGRRWVLAKGTSAKKGKDGWYEFLFDKDVKESEPKIREDGSVDYSPNIQMVQKGDKVAIYHPPVEGENGVTVFGTVISPVPSKDAPKLSLKNVEQIENDLVATKTGKVTYRGGTLSILNCLIIDGNAGYATGMIQFNGDVWVKGDIKDGVIMSVDGNLEVDGTIDAAQLKVGKSLIVHGGIHGKQKANIEVGGTMTASFIEGATVISKKDVNAGHLINATIISDNCVNVEGKDGAILGGDIQAEECISAARVGNETGCKTSLKIKSSDAYSTEYARIIVKGQVYPQTSVDINGSLVEDCTFANGELHLTGKGIEKFEIGSYQYRNVAELLERQLKQLEGVKPPRKKRILVVDDDPVFLKIQYTYLSEDYEVVPVCSGSDALKFLDKKIPDLILLDYLMPRMTGFDILEKIRAYPTEVAKVPVFFLTSVTDKNVIIKCLSLHPQKFLIKPMTKEELLEILNEFFLNEEEENG